MNFQLSKYTILVLGDHKTGKTELVNSALYEKSHNIDPMPTIGMDSHEYTYNGTKIDSIMEVWDAGGMQIHLFPVIQKLSIANGFLIVFDVSNRQSFLNIDYWMDLIKDNSKSSWSSIIVGNITSAERVVPFEEGVKMAKKYKCLYADLNVKNPKLAKNIFRDLAANIVEKKPPDVLQALSKEVREIEENKKEIEVEKKKKSDCDIF